MIFTVKTWTELDGIANPKLINTMEAESLQILTDYLNTQVEAAAILYEIVE